MTYFERDQSSVSDNARLGIFLSRFGEINLIISCCAALPQFTLRLKIEVVN